MGKIERIGADRGHHGGHRDCDHGHRRGSESAITALTDLPRPSAARSRVGGGS
jgi:hypothetical protein